MEFSEKIDKIIKENIDNKQVEKIIEKLLGKNGRY